MISVLAAQVTDRQLIILVGGLIITTAIIFNRKIYVKVKNTEATVGGTDRQLNGRTKEESTVSEDVKEIRKEVTTLRNVVSSLHGTELERIDKINKRLDMLSSRHEKLQTQVQEDRHATQNTLGLIVLSTHEIKAKLDNPTLLVPVVDIAKGLARIKEAEEESPT